MKVELRPDTEAVNKPGLMPVLDEAVIEGACTVHAEMMNDRTLWIGIDDADGNRTTLVASVERVSNRYVLQLRGEEE